MELVGFLEFNFSLYRFITVPDLCEDEISLGKFSENWLIIH
jgi:hypothetical protein